VSDSRTSAPALFRTITDRQASVGLALLRVVAGVVFAVHGAQKLFVYGISGVQAGFAQMGVPFAAFMGPAVGVLELVGGILLIAGLLTRPVGALLAVVMLGALVLVHLPAGFFMPNGYELVLTLFAAAGALAATGAGAFSVDAVIARRPAEGDEAPTAVRHARAA
jgi:putative oxidoreductase